MRTGYRDRYRPDGLYVVRFRRHSPARGRGTLRTSSGRRGWRVAEDQGSGRREKSLTLNVWRFTSRRIARRQTGTLTPRKPRERA